MPEPNVVDQGLVQFDLTSGVLTLTINRPEIRNALNVPIAAALRDRVTAARYEPEVRCIVLTGAGDKGFCSGADVRDIGGGGPTGTERRLRENYHALIVQLRDIPKPVIGAVNGAAVGFGCDLALACDFRLGSENAMFAEVFANIGLMPDGGGTWSLPRIVGLGRAFELIYTARRVGAEEARELGILNHVYPVGEFREKVREQAEKIAAGPPLAFAQAKRALNQSLDSGLLEALDREVRGQIACLATADHKEGIAAFKEKRSPKFEGK